jgi:hypothetical protein
MRMVVGVPALILVVGIIVSFEMNKKKAMVMFDNRLATSVDIEVDGQLLAHVEAGKATLEVLPEHARQITARASGAVVASAEVSGERHGERGYRGLFTIGPPTDYVVAMVPYFAPDEEVTEGPDVVEVPTPAPLVELPGQLEEFEISRIDVPFLKTTQMFAGAKVIHERHLCRVQDGKIGCCGFDGH